MKRFSIYQSLLLVGITLLGCNSASSLDVEGIDYRKDFLGTWSIKMTGEWERNGVITDDEYEWNLQIVAGNSNSLKMQVDGVFAKGKAILVVDDKTKKPYCTFPNTTNSSYKNGNLVIMATVHGPAKIVNGKLQWDSSSILSSSNGNSFDGTFTCIGTKVK